MDTVSETVDCFLPSKQWKSSTDNSKAQQRQESKNPSRTGGDFYLVL